MDKKDVMKVTVELVSAYAGSLSENAVFLNENCIENYTKLIETVYKKVDELMR